MPLYINFSVTPELKNLAYEAASQLKAKTEIPIKGEEGKLFEYQWTDACSRLVREFSKTMAGDVKSALETTAGVKISKETPPDPAVLLPSKSGWLATTSNEIAILISLQTPEHAKIQFRSDMTGDNSYGETGLLLGSIVIVLERVSFLPAPTDQEGRAIETPGDEIPFVVVKFRTLPLKGTEPGDREGTK